MLTHIPSSTLPLSLTKEVPPGWKRGMSVLFDAEATVAGAGHTAVDVLQEPTAVAVHQEPPPPADPAPAHPAARPAKKRRVRVAKHHVRWFLSLADNLARHGWWKKDVWKSCQKWCPEVFAGVHEDTVYKWKSDEVAPNTSGKAKNIPSALAEKMTVMTHDMIKQLAC
eukprot:5366889-Amphidinium_carterae.1